MGGISRRRFVRDTAILGAGVALGGAQAAFGARMGGMGGGGMGGGGMGGGGMGGGGSVIDPPVGGTFSNPAELPRTYRTDGSYEYTLEAKLATVNLNGASARLMTYNGRFPGGVMRARKGDTMRVHFINNLPNDGAKNMLGHDIRTTNLHTHGLHVTPGSYPDGTHGDDMMVQITPGGGTADYKYDLTHMYPGTLNFYHPHIHGCVADQMWAGMAGPLVVEDDVTALDGIPTQIMMLKDITLSGGVPVPHTSMMQYMQGMEGSTVFVNDKVNPRLTIKKGQIQRWRICNSSTARFYRLQLQGHLMHVVGTEAGLLDRPYAASEILLSPGERVDVLVRADKTAASYKFLSLPYSRHGMMSSAQITLLTLTYSGSTTLESLPRTVDPMAMRMMMDTSMLPHKTITLSMGQGAGYINGIQFLSHTQCYTEMSTVGTHEVWEIVNPTGMDHPFHHHVNRAQVLSITGGDAGYASFYSSTPSWKDVTIVPKMGRVRLLMPIEDYDGHTMMHCHIIEHEDIGMMAMWHLMPGEMPPMG